MSSFLLVHKDVEGEVNGGQVEAMTWKGSVIIPVATFSVACTNNQMILDLPFPDSPVIFSLGQGNGLVHIIGNHFICTSMEPFDDMDEVIDEMDEDEQGEE
ncbi:hypothetical protein WA026_003985 [Henosepilachna vigintioctopunctata]|uniref:Nucleoplasmin core domain-containing protein n=1 Tax=Henosepilachna vigintioctopunctata TaxID=420089 RepID=A0AAW1UHD6_9CUCU